MNNCTLALTISQAPQIRYTPNSQIVGEAVGEFYSPHHHEKDEPSPASTLKVIAWGEHLTEQLNAVEVGELYGKDSGRNGARAARDKNSGFVRRWSVRAALARKSVPFKMV